ncbi:MAG: helix-turn-helix transcriptional regulator [Chloroflexota bacterium]
MATRERAIDRGRRLARDDRIRIGREIRVARHITGRSLDVVAEASGMSPSQASRIERGVLATVSIDQLARLGATVGVDIRTRSYPGPDPVVDAGQAALLSRLHVRLHPRLTLPLEVPLPVVQDQRAWDAVIRGLVTPDGSAPADDLPVEAETRLVDLQAQVRRIMLKARDAGVVAVLLVVADTNRNRDVLAASAALLKASFPISGRQAMAALREGRHPGGSAIVVL